MKSTPSISRRWLLCTCILAIAGAVPSLCFGAASPSITTPPSSQSVLAGSNAVFTVVASGQSPLGYQWSRNGTNLINSARISGATSATLTISNVVADDAGPYQIVVSNSHGSATTNATLTVFSPPTVTIPPANQSVNIAPDYNTTAQFDVVATGTPPLRYQWRFNGVEILAQTNSNLTITNVQLANDGNYTVVITNNYGITTSSVATLTIWAVLQMPQPTTVKWGGNAQFNVVVTNQHSLPITYQWWLNGTNLLAGQTNSTLLLTNVQPSQEGWYYVRWASTSGNISFTQAPLFVEQPPAGVPFISHIDPLSAAPGATVTISGTNFSPVANSNLVFFGATRATVLSASSTNLVAVVPVGATYAHITVNVNGLTGAAGPLFLPAFKGDGSMIGSSTFKPRQNIAGASGTFQTMIADLDGDGKPDLAVGNVYAHSISLFRNLGNNGALSASSFAPRVDLTAAGGGSDTPYGFEIADIDGDGKPDLLTCDRYYNQVAIYRNISSAGALNANSFALPVGFFTGSDPRHVRVADLDGDGRPELIVANYAANTISILQNLCTPGNFAFAPKVDFPAGSGVYDVAIADLDGDGKPDLAAVNTASAFLSLFRNVSSAGNIGSGSFTPATNVPSLNYCQTITVSDVDGDGKLDLIVGSIQGYAMSVFRNVSTPGSFAFAAHVDFGAPGWVHNVTAGDFNGDGKPDISMDGELASYMAVFQNGSTPGDFANSSLGNRVDFATGYNAWGLAVGDLNGDSRPDIALCNTYDSNLSVYENQSPFGGPPVILSQPTNATAVLNGSTALGANVIGQLPLSYQWFAHGTNLVDGDGIAGSTTANLILSNAQLSNAGDYYFVVTNNFGSATSEVVTVSVVIVPPDFTQQPQNLTNIVGGTATFTTIVSGSEPISYQWFQDGLPLSDGNRISGATTASLTISNLQTNDAFNYWLVVSNAANTATSSVVSLTVLIPPTFTQQPVSQTTAIGSNVLFTASADGSPPLNFQWYLNGNPLSDNPRMFGSMTSSLSISNVQSSDGGNYTVAVSIPGASITSSNATLTVLAPANVTTQPVGRSVPPGLPTTFTAAASGSALSYQWLLNGTNLPNANGTSYTIPAVGTNDLGVYQFIASNSVSVAVSSNALLTVGPIAAWGLNNYNQCLPPAGLSNVTSFSCANYLSLASLADDNFAAWGNAGSNTNSSFTNVIAFSAGQNGVLALRADGTVTGSGGISPLSFKAYPSNAVAVAAGYYHGLALRAEGTVEAWGSDIATAYFPVGVPRGLTKVTAIAAGYRHSLALRSDGTVVAWGSGVVTNVPAGLSNVVAIAAGSMHDLVLKSDGTLVAWGSGAGTNIPPGLSDVMAIGAGNYFDQRSGVSFAVRSNGTVLAWGVAPYNLTNLPSGLSNVVAVAGGAYHALALVNDGSPQILRQPAGGTAWSGSDWTLRVSAAGAAPLRYQWRFNGTNLDDATNAALVLPGIQINNTGEYQVVVSNALGVATSFPVPLSVMDSAPFLLTSPAPTNRPYIGSRFTFSAAAGGSGPMNFQWRLNDQNIATATNTDWVIDVVRSTNGGMYSFVASNSFGAVTSSVANLYPNSIASWGTSIYGATNVPINLSNAVAVALNSENAAALRADGTVATWGMIGTTVPLTISNISQIALGSSSVGVGLKTDGTVKTWGNGVNTAFSNSVAGLSNIVAIEADSFAGTFLKTDGTVTRILNSGATNFYPQLTNVVALSKFYDGFAALRADGTVFTSGTGTPPPPALVTNVFDIALERTYGGVLRRDGTLQTWGVYLSQTNASNIVAVSANAAVRADGTILPWIWSPNYPSLANVPSGLTTVSAVDASSSAVLGLLVVRDFPLMRLPDALNTDALVVSSRGSPQWFGQSTVSHDGFNAAQSAEIGNNTASSMRMWVTGPVQVSFWWKVSSETNHHFLSFSAGGILLTNISGETGWQLCTVTTPPGNQILQWTYSKDGATAAGQDAGWVDQLAITSVAPSIVTQPTGTNVLGGANVSLNVSAIGTPPLSYQWRKNGDAIGSATDSSLLFLNVTRSNSGTYSVVVTNVAGNLTSSNAVLTVRVPQLLFGPTLMPDGTLMVNSSDVDGGQLSPDDLVNFEAQASTNLVDWTALPGALSVLNGHLQLHDSAQTNFPARYYRIIEH